MGRGAVPTNHPYYVANLGMHGAYAANMAVEECDVLFSIGTRFNDRITGKLHAFAPNAKIVHIDIDTASISKNIHVDVPIVADAKGSNRKDAGVRGGEGYCRVDGDDSGLGAGAPASDEKERKYNAPAGCDRRDQPCL